MAPRIPKPKPFIAHGPQADEPDSLVVRFPASQPLVLDSGASIAPLQIAYQTYGELNAART
ncbi:MAG: homoserine O-acetyltransferase, partial [Beijerinckiaceae bacterium]